jgi:hypothetical protein
MMMPFLLSFAARAAEPTPASALEDPQPPPAPSCFPDCSPGYLCHDGTCIQACNPACPDHERCTEGRICVPKAVRPVETPAAATGELCLLRGSKFRASLAVLPIELDGFQFGLLANGRVLCEPVAVGAHRVTLQLGEIEHHFPAIVAPGETTYLRWDAANIQVLDAVSPAAGEQLRLALPTAKDKHRTWRAHAPPSTPPLAPGGDPTPDGTPAQ